MRTLFSFIAAIALCISAQSSAFADDPTPMAEIISGLGIAFEGEDAAVAKVAAEVTSYDAGGQDSGFEWSELYVDGDGKLSMEEVEGSEATAISDLIIGAMKDAEADTGFRTDNLWIMISAMLVFIMHLGFAALESGLTQAKNTVNILFKNTLVPCIGLVSYALIGFNLMYPVGNWIVEGYFPAFVPMIAIDMADPAAFYANMTSAYAGYTWWTDFIFQGMFAATAATIISGCVAERIKLGSFLVFGALVVTFVYPILGSWHWGGGWLSEAGFVDFAGSTLVHSVGGWAGLAAILVLGPRKGKYVDGQVRPILPSNLPLATIGVFLLWFGWFGFNGGSQLDADPVGVSYVLVTTSIAAALGGLAGGLTSWIFSKKPDLTMALNGILAGLVGITAAPDTSLTMAVITGLSSGVIVYFAVLFFDKIKIDDPVGALSVHLVCGIWGTLAGALGSYGPKSSVLSLTVLLPLSFHWSWLSSSKQLWASVSAKRKRSKVSTHTNMVSVLTTAWRSSHARRSALDTWDMLLDVSGGRHQAVWFAHSRLAICP